MATDEAVFDMRINYADCTAAQTGACTVKAAFDAWVGARLERDRTVTMNFVKGAAVGEVTAWRADEGGMTFACRCKDTLGFLKREVEAGRLGLALGGMVVPHADGTSEFRVTELSLVPVRKPKEA